jgi:hypothetical protein
MRNTSTRNAALDAEAAARPSDVRSPRARLAGAVSDGARMRAAMATGPRPEEPLPGAIPPRREFRCVVCGAEFVSRTQLTEHERLEHRTP